jgi:exodeoxyribonuclease VII large subunit
MRPDQERQIQTVSELTRQIKGLVEQGFDGLWVEGEVSNFKAAASGHMYFSLKDAGAQLKAVMWRGSRSGLRFELADGVKVAAYGRLSVYEPRGEYQMVVERMEPQGLGALQLAFEQLKRKLEAEGLFDKARKRPLPALPRRVAVVTSPTGAVIQDILNVTARRCPYLDIVVLPVKVQGEGAALEISQAIEAASLGEAGPVDLVVVARGGGSLEDLWAFNEEAVARAIFECRVPVLSAVGHETDFTIADFVADLRAPTPSAAAELMAPSREQLRQRLDSADQGMALVLERKLERLGQRAESLAARLARCSPALVLEQHRKRLAELGPRLAQALRNQVAVRHLALDGLTEKLKALSPLAILARGYAAAFSVPGGRLLKAAAEAKPGEEVRILLGQGALRAQVMRLEEVDHG